MPHILNNSELDEERCLVGTYSGKKVLAAAVEMTTDVLWKKSISALENQFI
jgi:hypothetical protein